MTALISPSEFTESATLLRSFFLARGFEEVHTQNRLSILAACEDPTTVATYNYNGEIWPLPQTGQMWLESELLKAPHKKGLFCMSTSYRQEPNIVEGRHETIFPMFEMEMPGTMSDLEEMERDLLAHCGFCARDQIVAKDYLEWCEIFHTEELDHDHERDMCRSWGGRPCMVQNFPNYTSPFWNMKQNGDGTAAKIDVIICEQETIGSAERGTDVAEMREMFHTISEGLYANLLFDKFGKNRVEKELDEFLSYDFFPRVGGGIGMTRFIRAKQMYNVRDVIQNMH